MLLFAITLTIFLEIEFDFIFYVPYRSEEISPGEQRKKRSKQDRHNSEGQNSLKQKKNRKPNVNVKWPKDLLCPDCGENIGKGRSKDGGKYILRHQLKHQVENFVCECPDVPKLIVRPDQERVGKDFILKERHMKTVHMGWFGCTQFIQSLGEFRGT